MEIDVNVLNDEPELSGRPTQPVQQTETPER